MNVVINDNGFQKAEAINYEGSYLWLENDTDISTVNLENVALISIPFPNYSDGRGFGLARALRRAGFNGHLRAVGHVIADQYAMARRVGFDDVEISDELAARQPEAQWMDRAKWQTFDYQSRLGQNKAEIRNERTDNE